MLMKYITREAAAGAFSGADVDEAMPLKSYVFGWWCIALTAALSYNREELQDAVLGAQK